MLGTAVLVAYMAMVLVALAFPFVAVVLHLWFDLTAPQFAFWNYFGDIGVSTFSAVIVVLGFFIGYRGKLKLTPISVFLILFIIWFCITYIDALATVPAAHKFDRAIKSLLPVVLCMVMLTTRRRIELLLWMYLAAVCVFGARAGILTLVTGGGYGLDLTGNSLGSVMFESSTFAVALMTAIPLLFYAYKHSSLLENPQRFKWLFIVVGALNLVAAIGTFARSGLVAAAAMATVSLFLLPNKIRNTVLFSVCVGTALFLAPNEWFERMATINTFNDDASASGRIAAWKYAWDLASTRLMGGGFGAFNLHLLADNPATPGVLRYVESHSWFFEAMGEHGFIGCFLLTLIFCYSLFTCAQAAFSKTNIDGSDSWRRHLGRAMLLSMIGLTIGGLFIGIASHTFTYILPAICSGLLSTKIASTENDRYVKTFTVTK